MSETSAETYLGDFFGDFASAIAFRYSHHGTEDLPELGDGNFPMMSFLGDNAFTPRLSMLLQTRIVSDISDSCDDSDRVGYHI